MAYIGKTPSQATRSRFYYTATGGETSLSGADDNGNTLVFSDGNYVDVMLNGVNLVAGTDYNTTTANTIGGLTALTASDIVEIVVYDTFSVFGGDVKGDFNVQNGTLTAEAITGSGDMNIDSGTLFVDASENRVGIGTSLPSRRLEIAGSVNTSDSLIKITNNVVGTEHIELQSGINGVSNAGFQLNVNGTARMAVTDAGLLQFNSGYGSVATAYGCRAWVQFDMNGASIKGDGNVSSLTDNGIGEFTVNFTNSMPDDDYGFAITSEGGNTTNGVGTFVLGGIATSSLKTQARTTNNNTLFDSEMSVTIFR
tara:strand:- start:338 stop:1270 length:933 start_codon:yes stop_codon:yes gene_type:complete